MVRSQFAVTGDVRVGWTGGLEGHTSRELFGLVVTACGSIIESGN